MKAKPVRFFRAPNTNLFYVNNPKVACSSIKYSLLGYYEAIHVEKSYTPLKSLPSDARFFSVVRDPFARLVSGYLDKIHRPTNIASEMSDVVGDIGKHVSATGEALNSNFREFVQSIARFKQKRRINPHFRPQHMNLNPSELNYEFLGSLHHYSEVELYLCEQGFEVRRYTPHATDRGLKTQLEALSDVRELSQHIFARDYELFATKLAIS